MKFICTPDEGVKIDTQVAEKRMRKALTEEETLMVTEGNNGTVEITIGNIGRTTRSKVSDVLETAIGMSFTEVEELAA